MKKPNFNLFFQKINSKPWLSFLFWYCSFFILAILVRLPHFLSNAFWFDGDEAIVGIMAQDLLAGKNFTLYFYGQSYGLTIFESLSVAGWIKILGTGIWALRLGGLTVFTFGIYFLFKGLIARGRTQVFAFLFTFAVLCFPTWMLWGAFVRGGYVTAFAASFLLFYLISLKNFSWKYVVFIALALTIVLDSHNLLLFALAPLLLRDWLINKGSILKLIVGLGIATGFYFLLHSTVVDNGHMYKPWMDYTISEFPSRWQFYYDGFIHSFGGFYYLGYLFNIPEWWKWLMILSLVLITTLTILLFIKSKRKDRIYFILWLIGLIGLLFICAFPVGYSARYLISFFTGFIFLFAFYDSFVVSSKWIKGISILILLIFIGGIGVGSKQSRDWYETHTNCVDAMEDLHKEVLKHKLKAVFVTVHLIQWQWNYLYGNEIPSNGFNYDDRLDNYWQAADSIYQIDPQKTGIIGNWGIFLEIDKIPGFNDTRYIVHEKYFLQPIMTKEFHDKGYLEHGGEYRPRKLKK